MNNMKKILNEWRGFVLESKYDKNPFIAKLEKRILDTHESENGGPVKYTKKQMMEIISPWFVSRVLDGRGMAPEIVDFFQKYSPEAIRGLTENFDDHYYLEQGGGLDFFNKRVDKQMVSLMISDDSLKADNPHFKNMDEIQYYLNLLIRMLENKDYDFELLKRTYPSRTVDTIPGGGASDVGFQMPQGTEEKEQHTPEYQRFRTGLSNFFEVFRTTTGETAKEMQMRFDASKEMKYVYEYMIEMYNKYGHNQTPEDRKLILGYKQAIKDLENWMLKHPRPEKTLDELVAMAKAGDKEAAKQAREMFRSLGKNREAYEMRLLMR